MRIKQLHIILSILFASITMQAQDIHFSQFYNSPLTANPTLTGLMDGKYRLGVIYRNQWRSVSTPYTTVSASFDMPVKTLGNGDKLGVGGVLFYDKAGAADLSTFNFNASFAYHKSLSKTGAHYLSLGVQAGLTQKRYDLSNEIFADQVNGGLQVDGSTQDPAADGNIIHENLNVGLSYSGKLSKNAKLFLGGAVFNITQPNESFGGLSGQKLPMRYVGNGSLEIVIKEKIALLPSAIYMLQAGASEVNLGMGLQYRTADFRALLGVYYRINDAIIPVAGLEYKGLAVTFSYDYNNSGLDIASSGKGAWELSLLFTAPGKKTPYKYPVFFAPRF